MLYKLYEWHLFKQNGSVELKIDKTRLPYMAQAIDAEIENVMFVAKVKDDLLNFTISAGGNPITLTPIEDWPLYGGYNSDIDLDTSFELTVDQTQLNNLEDLMMVVKFSF